MRRSFAPPPILRRGRALVLGLLVVACQTAPALAPTQPPATQVPELASVPSAASTIAPPQAGIPSGAAASPRGPCPKERPQLPPLAAEPVSPARASIYLENDLGISSPIYANIWRFPIAVVVAFDAAVDPATFRLEIARFDSCGYFDSGLDQETRWLSDREARITVRPPVVLGEYAVTFGRGRDRAGREVQEPRFQFIPSMERPSVRIGDFGMPSGPVRWIREVEDQLMPVSASPDGRFALLVRDRFANASDHSLVRIPYLLDLASGALTPYPRGVVWNVRWDTARGAVWINGTTYLDLERPGTSVDLLERLPSDPRHVADARVSPDRRWLAALLASTDETQLQGDAELVVVDLRSGEVRSRARPFRFLRSPGGRYLDALSWSSDSMALLVTSYLGFEERGNGTGVSAEYHVVLVAGLTLRRLNGIGEAKGIGYAEWAPAGEHVAVPGHGILRADGAIVLRDGAYWPTRIWSRDGRFTLIAKEYQYEVLDLTSGTRRPIGLTIDPGRPISILGIADTGDRLYLGDPYGR